MQYDFPHQIVNYYNNMENILLNNIQVCHVHVTETDVIKTTLFCFGWAELPCCIIRPPPWLRCFNANFLPSFVPCGRTQRSPNDEKYCRKSWFATQWNEWQRVIPITGIYPSSHNTYCQFCTAVLGISPEKHISPPLTLMVGLPLPCTQ